jgi:hypothetical protein
MSEFARNWSGRQRMALVIGLTAVAISIVMFVTPVGSAPESRAAEPNMIFCGSVVSMEHDAGDCGTRLASRRTAAWAVLVAGVVFASGGVWALRRDDAS